MSLINFLDDPVMLILLSIGLIIGLIIKSKLLIAVIFGLAAMGGLKHFLMGGFALENTTLASILFLAGMVLVAFIIIYQFLVRIK